MPSEKFSTFRTIGKTVAMVTAFYFLLPPVYWVWRHWNALFAGSCQ